MRPRLVEEGKPIPYYTNEDRNRRLISSLETSEHTNATKINVDKSNSDENRLHNVSSLNGAVIGNQKRRSLQSLSSSDYKLKTSIVIGSQNSVSNSHKSRTNSSFEIGKQETSDLLDISMEIQADNNCYSMDIDDNRKDNNYLRYAHNAESTEAHHNYQTEKMISSFVPERMEIDDSLAKTPLVVIDGPNVAYAYAQVSNDKSSLSLSSSKHAIEPDVRGIQIASNYFINAGCRVQIIIPMFWLRRKPKNGTNSSDNLLMMTEQLEILQELKSQNLLLCSPPTDDDDAYAIAIARREDSRSKMRMPPNIIQSSLSSNITTSTDVMSISGAFILSNDLFRDAIQRDISGDLSRWLRGNGTTDNLRTNLPGRISYSFCDVGCQDLDFVPNPRHSLVEIIERYNHSKAIS